MLFVFFISGHAEEWETLWIQAIEACDKNDFLYAEQYFDEAIEILEKECNQNHPNIYIDRARLYLALNKHEKVILDVDKAFALGKLRRPDQVNATAIRVAAKAFLGHTEGFEEDIAFLSENSQITVDNIGEKLILRNIPNCDKSRDALALYFLMTGLCNDLEDVKFLPSGVCIVTRTSDCLCRRTSNPRVEQRTIEGCKNWCDISAVGGMTWCSKAFASNGYCLLACNTAVYALQKGCHWCCQDGAFYEKCAAPFADILSAMSPYIKTPCDPMWD